TSSERSTPPCNTAVGAEMQIREAGIGHAGHTKSGTMQRCAPDLARHMVTHLRPAYHYGIGVYELVTIDQPGIAGARRLIGARPTPQDDRLAGLGGAGGRRDRPEA